MAEEQSKVLLRKICDLFRQVFFLMISEVNRAKLLETMNEKEKAEEKEGGWYEVIGRLVYE